MLKESFPFEDPAFLTALEERFADIINFDQEPEAAALAWNINDYLRDHRQFSTSGSALLSRCLDLMNRAIWIGLPLLSDGEIINLLRSSLSVALAIPDFSFVKKNHSFIAGVILINERDNIKQRMRQAML